MLDSHCVTYSPSNPDSLQSDIQHTLVLTWNNHPLSTNMTTATTTTRSTQSSHLLSPPLVLLHLKLERPANSDQRKLPQHSLNLIRNVKEYVKKTTTNNIYNNCCCSLVKYFHGSKKRFVGSCRLPQHEKFCTKTY